MSHILSQLTIVGTASSMLVCCLNTNSPDFPGGNHEPNEAPLFGATNLWSVTDADSGELLANGCNTEPAISGVVPGQKLVVETRSAHGVAPRDGRQKSGEFWCSDDPSIHRQPDSEVDSVACWRAAKEGSFGSAARLLAMEVIPSPSPSLTSLGITPTPNGVPGQGHRFSIEVLNAGHAFVESTGQCDTRNEQGQVQPKGSKGIIWIKCGPITPCSRSETCSDRDECVVLRCDDATPCPDNRICVDSRCTLQ